MTGARLVCQIIFRYQKTCWHLWFHLRRKAGLGKRPESCPYTCQKWQSYYDYTMAVTPGIPGLKLLFLFVFSSMKLVPVRQ